MTRLSDLISPPKQNMSDQERYAYDTAVFNMLDGLTAVTNTAQTTNSDFSTLSGQGTTPTTPANGDNFQFIQNWFVVGATQANYVITAMPYPQNSLIASQSVYFVNTAVSTYTGTGFYFYQRQLNTVRKYQNQFITITINANNNQNKAISMRNSINSNYGSTNYQIDGQGIYLQPGSNSISTTFQTQSLEGITVTSGNYTDFLLNFVDLVDGTANIDLYSIKVEFGTLSTNL